PTRALASWPAARPAQDASTDPSSAPKPDHDGIGPCFDLDGLRLGHQERLDIEWFYFDAIGPLEQWAENEGALVVGLCLALGVGIGTVPRDRAAGQQLVSRSEHDPTDRQPAFGLQHDVSDHLTDRDLESHLT